MARALIVGCGCRGRALGRRLLAEDWAVRGTSREPSGLDAIIDAGLEGALADPDQPGTVHDLVGDITVVVWLLGSATGEPSALESIHGSRLESLLHKLVDTPVRGFLYESVGSVEPTLLAEGRQIVAEAGERWRIPVAFLDQGGLEPEAWIEDAARCVFSAAGLTS